MDFFRHLFITDGSVTRQFACAVLNYPVLWFALSARATRIWLRNYQSLLDSTNEFCNPQLAPSELKNCAHRCHRELLRGCEVFWIRLSRLNWQPSQRCCWLPFSF